MKNISLSLAGAIALQWIATTELQAGVPQQTIPGGITVRTSETSDTANALPPNAVVLSVDGKCEYSDDGVHFVELTAKDVFKMFSAAQKIKPEGQEYLERKDQRVLFQGAILRTGDNACLDIFFRRIGTTVRLQANTEVKLEKMSRSMKHGVPVLDTLLDLRKGRIFTVVRSLVEGSTFEIRNAAGRSRVEGAAAGGMGRYIITADGTQVADKSSLRPLELVHERGITVIAPGQKFDVKEGKMLSVATPETVLTLIEFDKIHAMSEEAAKQPFLTK
jgi:hypothetical protein